MEINFSNNNIKYKGSANIPYCGREEVDWQREREREREAVVAAKPAFQLEPVIPNGERIFCCCCGELYYCYCSFMVLISLDSTSTVPEIDRIIGTGQVRTAEQSRRIKRSSECVAHLRGK